MTQKRAILSWAEDHRTTVIDWAEDLDPHEPLAERAGFMQALLMLRAEQAGTLLVAEHAVLAPDPAMLAVAFKVVSRCGASLVAARDDHDVDCQAVKAARHALDAYHKLLWSPSITWSARERRREGLRPGGAVPYGYRVSDDGKRLVEDDHEQAAIALAVELRAERKSYRQISEALEEAGFLNRRGARMTPQTIKNLVARGRAVATEADGS